MSEQEQKPKAPPGYLKRINKFLRNSCVFFPHIHTWLLPPGSTAPVGQQPVRKLPPKRFR